MTPEIASLRLEYSRQTLLEEDVARDPFQQFGTWWRQAVETAIVEPNAMTLATASADGMPAARIVLLKDFDDSGFVFFTNYNSYKGLHLQENPKACLVFFWKELERQVRITGLADKLTSDENDEYFSSRPLGSRIGAIASPQSQVIEGRNWLDEQYAQQQKLLSDAQIKRPPHWGGYKVKPVIIEFWQGRPNRMHDRLQYSLQEGASWKIERLAP